MLNKDGFTRKSYDELVFDLVNKVEELFGSDTNTSKHSVIGIIIRILAWFLSLAYELLEKVYYSGFISQASGVSLDRLAANNGIYRNPESVAMVLLDFEGKENYVINEGVRFATESKIMFEMIDKVTLDSNGKGAGMAISIDAHPRANVLPNTIIVQVEPTEEITSVNNPKAAEGGMERETDSEFRRRIRLSIRSNPGPPVNGIISSILQVPGVRTVNLIENNTAEIDKYGNPPKSVHIFVDGGIRDEVGRALFSSVAAGIETVGEELVVVKDIGGFSHDVFFDYAQKVPIYISITVEVNEGFPTYGKEEINRMIVDHIQNLTMGSKVRYSYLYPIVYQLPGVLVANIKIGLSPDEIDSVDIELSPNQTAYTEPPNVEVIVNEI